MTKHESIIRWFNECPYVDNIQTAQTDDDVAGLYKMATISKETYIDGTELITENYYILFKRNSAIEENRKKNVDIVEKVENWIIEQNEAEYFPFRNVQSIEQTNAGDLIGTENNTSIYQINIAITYMRGVPNDQEE